MHVMASVRCGHPVVVTGKLGINEWQSETGPRTVVQVDAAAVGHDLSFGTANFSRSGGRGPRAENSGTGQGREDAGEGPEEGTSGVVRGEAQPGGTPGTGTPSPWASVRTGSWTSPRVR